MKRTSTKPVILSTFEFTQAELQQFGLESEQLEYMEIEARNNLASAGLPHQGGDLKWWFSYDGRPSTLSLAI